MSRTTVRVDVAFEFAHGLIAVAVREGKQHDVAVTVSIVDSALGLVAYGRADGSMVHSAETSRRKAYTAASTRRPSGWMQGDFALALPMGSGNILTNIRGGLPIVLEGRVVGGLGVAGGTPGQDFEIGKAALAAVGAEVAEHW